MYTAWKYTYLVMDSFFVKNFYIFPTRTKP